MSKLQYWIEIRGGPMQRAHDPPAHILQPLRKMIVVFFPSLVFEAIYISSELSLCFIRISSKCQCT